MILGLKPMGKPTTWKKKQRFWTESGHCMVLGLTYRETNCLKEKTKVLDRIRALYGPPTQAYGETNYLKEKVKVLDRTKWFSDSSLWENQLPERKSKGFGQNQGIVWSSDSSLWGNQLPERKDKGSGHNLDIVWSSDSIPWRGYPLIIGLIPRPNGIPGLSLDPQFQGN